MSQSELNFVSSHIFDCLQAHYWSEKHWSAFKGEVEQLAQSINRYSEYFQRSCKKSCFNQLRLTPVRQVSENVSFQFLPQCSSLQPILNELSVKLQECANNDYLAVGDTFEVADHDFTKFGIIPSVTFVVDIPEDVKESWYDGRVFIGMKEALSNHLCHIVT